MDQQSKTHYILAALLGVAGLLIILIFVSLSSKTTSVLPTLTNVNNTNPVVNTVRIGLATGDDDVSNGTLMLNENSTKSIFVNGSFTDENTCKEIEDNGYDGLKIKTHRSGFGSCNSGPNNNHLKCYFKDMAPNTDCYITGCTNSSITTANYECEVKIAFNADRTDSGTNGAENWVAEVQVNDIHGGSSGYVASSTFEIAKLSAINVASPDINYGSVALGGVSGVVTTTIQNYGNDNDTDLFVYGSAMPCSNYGTIPVSKQFYHVQNNQATSSMVSLNSVTSTAYQFDMPKANNDDPGYDKNLYWKIQLPATGISGSCSSTNTILVNGS